MTVRTFAFALMALGLALLLVGWQTVSPAGFVGVALIALGAILLWTRRTPRHGR
ncbi:hypothetical protein [Halomonas sp. NO4]|uniref:hypothetical protein n=1 Tax=Halomonas sp. NO4 TaxID=2484813 RepID=UPI0013D19C6E|nr:hypothetical protein [Halomonas sp. NO4]